MSDDSEGPEAPFSPEELQEVATDFAERCRESPKKLALPPSDTDIDFRNVEFERDAFFQRYLFSRSSSFQGSTFSSGAIFDGATFAAKNYSCGATFSFGASFERAAVSVEASFATATFSGEARFERAAFSDGATFHGATFRDCTSFGRATFSGETGFQRAIFSSTAFFDNEAFSRGVSFNGAVFSDGASFDDATFYGRADFDEATFGKGSKFVNAEMKGETSFEEAIFDREPPRFFGARLHQGTVWRGINWPTPNDAKKAETFLDAYACLKLEMDRLKKHEDELDFFALEFQSRRALVGPWRGFPTALYGALSNYGRSYAWPFLWLLAVVALAVLAFTGPLSFEKSLGLSVPNTLSILGLRRELIDASVITSLSPLLKVFSAVQTILGTILLFLFGLGVRNKFRMK